MNKSFQNDYTLFGTRTETDFFGNPKGNLATQKNRLSVRVCVGNEKMYIKIHKTRK